MANHDIYSNRNKTLPDIYRYDEIPIEFRNQVIHIWDDFIDQFTTPYEKSVKEKFYVTINRIIAKEHGLYELPVDDWNRSLHSASDRLDNYFRFLRDIDKVFDIIEIVFRKIESYDVNFIFPYHKILPTDTIEELNLRFRRAALGYEYMNGNIIRIDSIKYGALLEEFQQEGFPPVFPVVFFLAQSNAKATSGIGSAFLSRR